MNTERLARERIHACLAIAEAAQKSLAGVAPDPEAPWLKQRVVETTVRAFRTFRAIGLLAQSGLWESTYVLARHLFEDAITAHWLVTHDDLEALHCKYTEHLEATRFADLQAQMDLDLDLDPTTKEWQSTVDLDQAKAGAEKYWQGGRSWTTKTLPQLVNGVKARGLPGREYGEERVRLLVSLYARWLMPLNLVVHHSPAANQNWYAPAHEMLPDSLRVAYLSFVLLARLALEEVAPERVSVLQESVWDHSFAFYSPTPQQCAETKLDDSCPCGSERPFRDCHSYVCPE